MTRGVPIVLLAALLTASMACAGALTAEPPPSSDTGRTAPTTSTRVDPAQAARLQRIMLPPIRVMDHPMPLDQVKVGIMTTGCGRFSRTSCPIKIAPLAGQLVTSQYSRGEEYATHPGTADRIAAVQKLP
jgi:hypothetical protein